MLDKGYLGGGASARSTAIIRANYLTPEGIPFFRESLKLYENLSQELDFNLLFSQMGRLDLGHTESAVYWLRLRAEYNQLLGVDSRLIGPQEIRELVPVLDLREGKTMPVQAALYHPPAGVIRHDAVVYGLARGADRLGAELHPFTEVTGITRENGRVTGVEAGAVHIKADTVVSATAGWSSIVAAMVGLRLPIKHLSVTGVCHRAAQAVSRQDHLVRQPARLRVPDGPRRGSDRRACRPIPHVQP